MRRAHVHPGLGVIAMSLSLVGCGAPPPRTSAGETLDRPVASSAAAKAPPQILYSATFGSAGCFPTNTAFGMGAVTVQRSSIASYVDALGVTQVCGADTLRVDDAGVRIEPARTNSFADPVGWRVRGGATAVRDGTVAPDGVTHAVLFSGIGAYTVRDAYFLVKELPPGVPIATSLWIKKVSTSGKLLVGNASDKTRGAYTVDFAFLPEGWQRIGPADTLGVMATTAWASTPSGTAGVHVYSLSGETLSFYLGTIQQEVGAYPTTSTVTYELSVANTLASPNDLTTAAWARQGTATATRDGTIGPDGATEATLLSGMGPTDITRPYNDIAQTRGGYAAAVPAPTTLWIKKVTSSGTVSITNAQSAAFGTTMVDLAALPEGWQKIGDAPVPGVTITKEWTTAAWSGAGVRIGATAGAPLSFYVAEVTQTVYAQTPRAADRVAIANPLRDSDRGWCIQAGIWSLGSGPNSASLAFSGADLVFSVTDKLGRTKTVTAPAVNLRKPKHNLVACNDGGALSLYVDGTRTGQVAGTGNGIIMSMPPTLTITESVGADPLVQVSRSADASLVLPALPPVTGPSLYVAFTIDDGWADAYDYTAPVLDAHGMKGTFFLIRDFLGVTDEGYMTVAESLDLHARGHEIGSHSFSHDPMTIAAMPYDRIQREICDTRARWLEEGIPVRSFAYPGGANDEASRSLVGECGYVSARAVGPLPTSGFEDNPPAGGWYTLGEYSLTNTTTLADLQNAVTFAEENVPPWATTPGVLIFLLHHVCPNANCAASLAIDDRLFSAFLDWLAERKARGTFVATLGDAFGGDVKPAVWSAAPLVINGDMESYLKGIENAPDCWSRITTGANATWSRVGGVTGYAQQAILSGWTTGPVILREHTGYRSACSIPARPGKTYTLTCKYRSDVPVRLVVRQLLDVDKTFPAWTQSDPFPASPMTWATATWTTPSVPAGVIAVSEGLGVVDGVCTTGCLNGPNTATFVVDDCSAVEND